MKNIALKRACLSMGLAAAVTGAQAFDVDGFITPGHQVFAAIFMYSTAPFSEWKGVEMINPDSQSPDFPAFESSEFQAHGLDAMPYQFAFFGVFETDHIMVSFDTNYAPNAVGRPFDEEFSGWHETDVDEWIINRNIPELSILCAEHFFDKFPFYAHNGASLVSYSDGVLDGSMTINTVPEPASLAALGLGLAAMKRRKRRV